jgi:hypothetical protein
MPHSIAYAKKCQLPPRLAKETAVPAELPSTKTALQPRRGKLTASRHPGVWAHNIIVWAKLQYITPAKDFLLGSPAELIKTDA